MLWGAVAPPRLLQPPGSVPLGRGIHWESSEIHRNPTKSIEIHWESSENPLKSSGIHRNPLESVGNPRISPAADSRKTTKIAGKSRKITGGPTKNHPENGPKIKIQRVPLAALVNCLGNSLVFRGRFEIAVRRPPRRARVRARARWRAAFGGGNLGHAAPAAALRRAPIFCFHPRPFFGPKSHKRRRAAAGDVKMP